MKLLSVIVALFLFIAIRGQAEQRHFITLASTTSIMASGLYDQILPKFTEDTGIGVHVVAVGTGQALRLARNGDADALLVHHPPSERSFVAKGYGLQRHLVMYNQFLIVGPENDPATAGTATDPADALRRVARTKATFVSRGDNSGTHLKELGLWRSAGVDPKPGSGVWYMETGSGMGATLRISSAMQGYSLTDRGTWLSYRDRNGLRAVFDRPDTNLRNQYSVIIVNPDRHAHVKATLAQRFVEWLTDAPGQAAINAVTMEGQRLFIPNATTTK